jgi:4-amino-4-deoxy-L-arabinose transferase-like glycosyltransferase
MLPFSISWSFISPPGLQPAKRRRRKKTKQEMGWLVTSFSFFPVSNDVTLEEVNTLFG